MPDHPEVTRRLDAVEAFLPDLEAHLIDLQKGDLDVGTKSTDVDLVTKADYESEAALTAFIQSNFPGDTLLAEEGSTLDASPASAGFQWVVDPIDGTVNYAHGLPGWSISIALTWENRSVGGLVSAPVLGHRYRAVQGGGAFKNRELIRVNEFRSLRQGLVVTGFPYDRAKRAEPLARALQNMLHVAGGIRRLGSAALDYCYVAEGVMTGYYEMALNPWDSAAGSLIVQEAGGMVTDLAGGPFDPFTSPGTIASNGHVHAELVEAATPMLEAIAIE